MEPGANNNHNLSLLGVISDLGKSAIEGFRASPSCLGAVILCGGMAILTYLSLRDERVVQHQEMMMALRACPSTYEMSTRRIE